jgi:alpha-L-fucosidase
MKPSSIRLIIGLFLSLLLLTSVLQAADHPVPAIQDSETKEQRDARMAWWREARFGMFIHWGLYAVPAGSWKGKWIYGLGEWIMNRGRIPVADYSALADQFNPTQFNADAWVALAKAAGMKYIVITAKHHDGFAMFKSEANPFNIVDATPFKRDPLKELAAACQKQGMKFGFYYSQDQDWTAPGGSAMEGGHWDKAQDGSFADYEKTKVVPQLKELLNNYQPFPAVLWFDTPTKMTPALAAQIVEVLNQHPNLIWNNRLGGGYQGDTETPEQTIPPNGFPGKDWETCMTINDTWGYKSGDTNWKSTELLLRNLIDIASKGGNYLLNVGPDAQGVIPQPEVDRLKAIGEWMKVNGEAIYGTQAGPFTKTPPWGRITRKDQRLYLHVFSWPQDGKLVLPIRNAVSKAYLLASPGTALETTADESGVEIKLPAAAPDPIASVIAVDFTGPVDPQPFPPPAQNRDGSIHLGANDADLLAEGGGAPAAKLEGDTNKANIGYWMHGQDYAQWKIAVTRLGTFQVTLNYAAAGAPNGIDFALAAGDQTLAVTLPPTGGWATYRTSSIGEISISKTGVVIVTAKRGGAGKGAINLRSISLALPESSAQKP